MLQQHFSTADCTAVCTSINYVHSHMFTFKPAFRYVSDTITSNQTPPYKYDMFAVVVETVENSVANPVENQQQTVSSLQLFVDVLLCLSIQLHSNSCHQTNNETQQQHSGSGGMIPD